MCMHVASSCCLSKRSGIEGHSMPGGRQLARVARAQGQEPSARGGVAQVDVSRARLPHDAVPDPCCNLRWARTAFFRATGKVFTPRHVPGFLSSRRLNGTLICAFVNFIGKMVARNYIDYKSRTMRRYKSTIVKETQRSAFIINIIVK